MESDPIFQKTSQEYAQGKYREFVVRFPRKMAEKEESLFARFSNHRGNVISKLRDLYTFTDELMKHVAPFTACSKVGRGCSGCCYLNVSVTDLEIQIITEGAKVKAAKSRQPEGSYHGVACTFLKDGACSIYEYRPFRCRTHISFDQNSYWCDPERTMAIEMPNLRFSEVEKVFDSLRIGLPIYDIRQAFPQGKK